MSHEFKVETFSKPTFCDSCDAFLWGVIKQGISCKHCGMNFHKKCGVSVDSPCPILMGDLNRTIDGRRSASFSSHNSNASTSSIENSLTNLKVQDHSSKSASDYEVSTKKSPKQPKNRKQRAATSTSFVQELANNTAAKAAEMKKASKPVPLSFGTTMPKNLTRFVMRITPLVQLQDFILELLSWKNPSRSLIALLSFVVVCLLPTLFLILPQIGFMYYIIHLYYEKSAKEYAKKKNIISTTFSNNAQYLRNFRFIQNHMGAFVDAYEEIKSHKSKIDWSDEDVTLGICKYVVASAFLVIITVRFVPLNLIALAGGCFLFVQNTPFVRAASTTLPPVFLKGLQDHATNLQKSVASIRLKSKDEDTRLVVNLMENQRWWAGLGWIPHLLRSERKAWTDETGDIQRPDKDTYDLPSHDWEWLEDSWTLDKNWYKGVDDDAWVYTDHNWEQAAVQSSMSSLTRRRKWVRTMQMKRTYKVKTI